MVDVPEPPATPASATGGVQGSSETKPQAGSRIINTGGGAYIEGAVNTGGGAYIEGQISPGGDFIGRDKIINIHNYPPISRAPLREVFDPLIENRTALFGGREASLSYLADQIQAAPGGYLVITAPAGFGKTALLAQLISLKPEAFAYHFFTPSTATVA